MNCLGQSGELRHETLPLRTVTDDEQPAVRVAAMKFGERLRQGGQSMPRLQSADESHYVDIDVRRFTFFFGYGWNDSPHPGPLPSDGRGRRSWPEAFRVHSVWNDAHFSGRKGLQIS